MPGALENKVAIVTGASQGIGEAVAWRYAEQGARLVLSEVDDTAAPVAAAILARHPGSDAVAVATDPTDPAATDALVATAVDRHGGLDVLAHATAVPQRPVPAAELSPEEWDRVFAVNAKGPFLLCRSAVPVLTAPGGAIVFTGSFCGELGRVRRAAYCASKGALRLFTQSLALELAEVGIRVNGVAPAFVESAMGREVLEATAAAEGIDVEQAREARDATVPMRRQGEAREIADAFLYLATDSASYVTGVWLDVNGGLVLR